MKWEYKVFGAHGIENEAKWLNKLGSKGWELIQVLVYGDYAEDNNAQFDYYFKRRVEINEKLRKIQLKEVPNNDDEPESSGTAGDV